MKGEQPRRRHTQDELYPAPLVALGPWLASHGVSTASHVPPRDSDWPSEQNGPFGNCGLAQHRQQAKDRPLGKKGLDLGRERVFGSVVWFQDAAVR